MPRLKVAVRVRPLSQTEKSTDSNSIIKIENQQTITITNVKVPEQNAGDSRERVRRFTFDYCFDENSTQDEVFETVDNIVAKAVKNHQHSCVLAYGQSSSGKTHTMMGTLDDSGITPRLCSKVHDYFEEGVTEQEKSQTRNTVSYLEIYNEKVRDLLTNDQEATIKALKVREHPRRGPYVQGLTEHVIQDEASLVHWLQVGNNSRKVAATSSNPRSSRSHSVFTITGFAGTKLHLIDLAGSERASHLQNSSCRFREGANINKSLVALGNVISVLAEKSSKQGRSYRRFVPYRDSLLTWLLRDTFGGNSTTVMIATISPSSGCYSETVNTLRFGQRAKQIVLQPVVNEDPKERTIRELRAEILRLRELLIERSKINAEIDLESSADFKGETKETITKVDESSLELTLNKSNEENHLANQQPASPTVVTEQLLPLISFTTSLETTNPKMQSITRKSSTSQESLSDVKNEPKTKPKRIPISRRPSEEKVSKPKATLLRSGSDPNNPAKKEKGTVTEIKGPATKLDGNKKSGTVTKPRSAIVAAVTERLYAKVKKKEIATETDRKEDDEEKDVPQELKICSNARLKLQELTQKALRAHRRRNEETQTDMFPVLRVKEIATDVDDLRVALGEIKDAETEPELLEFKSVGIDCTELSTFNNESKGKNNFTVTNTCGTQANEESKKNISFTKYLQEQLPPRYEIINPCNGNPIYTSTVNIHVSHNYINRSDNASEDSLEGQTQQNVFLPTPDLISNHNSLDAQHIHDPSSETSEQHVCECLEVNVAPEMCVANCVTIPNFRETVDVDVQKIFVPEMCLVGNSEECLVMEEDDLVYQVAKANVENVDEKVVVNDPVILKSIMKPTDSDSEEAELPDSLKYHQANTAKKVQFKKAQSNLEVDSDRMLKVMSRFLEEATTLLSNLSTAVNKIDNSKFPDSFNLEVSVNDITPLKRMKKRSKRSEMTTVSSTQTLQPETCDFSTNTSDWIPTNKYEKLVEDSCNRLERCIDKAMSIPSSVSRECLHRFPQPFEVWNFEESSGESNPTYSDYGSLPKRSRYAGGEGLRPSAFLRRLTNMRRQVIQDSREQMEQFEANDSEDI